MDKETLTEDYTSKVISIISNSLRIDEKNITMQSNIFKDLNAESIDILDIGFTMEQCFGFSISENEIKQSIGEGLSSSELLEKFTVEKIVEFVSKKLKIKENPNAN